MPMSTAMTFLLKNRLRLQYSRWQEIDQTNKTMSFNRDYRLSGLFFRYAISTGLLGCALAGVAGAQPYPSRPVRFLVGLPPGGSPVLVARTIANGLAGNWPHNVVV